MKRGETAPWRVRYVWSNGVKGTNAYTSRDLAELKADEIRRAAERREDVTVEVEVSHRERVTA